MPRRDRASSDEFAGHVVIVTGASQGIGREVARCFAEAGAKVGMIARERHSLELAASALPPGATKVAAADVSDERQISAAVAEIVDELGPVTTLVNNAGHGHWGSVIDTDPSTFRHAVEVNYMGVVLTTAQVLEGMLRRGSGHIVNVASIAGRIGAPFEAAYSASKFAVVGYSEALATEVWGTGVTVSLIDPGPVATDFFDRRGRAPDPARPRPLPPDQVARAVVAAVRRGHEEQFLPRWLRLAYIMKTAAPPLHRFGINRRFRLETQRLRRRFG